MTAHPPPPDDLNEPPAPQSRVLVTGLVGVGLVLLALGVGLATGAPFQGVAGHWADGPRALLAVAGLVVAGAAVSLRPGWFAGWLLYAAAGWLGYGVGTPPPDGTDWFLVPPRPWVAGVPNAWDSIQFFFGVAGGLAGLIGAAVCALPRKAVLVGILGAVVFHFAGVLSAITSPNPSSWLTDQYWKRVSRNYLHFVYLNNAYQFYSPEPGPATLLWVCVEYETDAAGQPDADGVPRAPVKDCEWKVIPRRPQDVRDPLGVSYYRRLSLTENITHTQPMTYPAEWDQVVRRRSTAAHIAKEPLPDSYQHLNPNQRVSQHILPSYARYFCRSLGDPAKTVKSVKVYRVVHTLMEWTDLRGGIDPATGKKYRNSPYAERLYQPVYMGTYDPTGRLVDPLDPVLYWRVPIRQHNPVPDDPAEIKRMGWGHYITDYVSIHAGCPRYKE